MSRPARSNAFTAVLLCCAAGVAAGAGAAALSRTGRSGAQALFWLAVVLILLPAALRIVGERPAAASAPRSWCWSAWRCTP